MPNERNRRPGDSPAGESLTGNTLATADAVARAAHIWIRSLCLTEMQTPAERHAMACGLVAGLCERLELHPGVEELVAYVYAVIDNDGGQALATSRLMLARSIAPEHRDSYHRGQSEAAAIVEMLAFLGPEKR
jgi:hypothetical protein